MPMGLTGSPPVFQSLMEKVLVGLTSQSKIPYLDDCIIFSRTAEEHIATLWEVFQRFKYAKLKINPLKCDFFRQHVPFLGHIAVGMGFKPIQLKHQLCVSIPSRNRLLRSKVSAGFLFLLPTVRSRFRRNCSTSSSAYRKNERNPLEPRSPNGL